MSERLTPSELVYLFVDGEATSAERTELYAALAGDGELQAEFEDALRLKQTTDEEVAAVVPPYSATKELFLKAGFAVPVPIAGGEAIAPIVSHIAEGGTWLASIKSFVMPFLAATGIATSAIVSMPFFERIDMRHAPVEAGSSTAIAATEGSTNTSLLQSPLESGAPSSGAPHTSADISATQPYRTARESSKRFQLATPPASAVSAGDLERTEQPIAATSEVTIEQVEAKEPAAAIAITLPEQEHTSISELRDTRDHTKRNLWFGGNGIAGLALYPGRATDGAQTVPVNNIAFRAEYELASGERVGIAAGSETFPHYVITNDTTLTQRWNIVWAGASYSVAAYDVAFGPFVPVFSALIGGAATGPLGKLSAGLAWQPDDRVRFAAGLESTGLMYHFGSSWRLAGKLGATYSVSVNF